MKVRKPLYLMMYLTLVILVLLGGCKKTQIINKDFTYKGESEHWQATYQVSGKMVFTEEKNKPIEYKGEGKGDFTLTYKGLVSELSKASNLEYSFEGKGNSYSMNQPITKSLDKMTFNQKDPNASVTFYNKDSVLKVTVSWDGDNGGTEIIELRSK